MVVCVFSIDLHGRLIAMFPSLSQGWLALPTPHYPAPPCYAMSKTSGFRNRGWPGKNAFGKTLFLSGICSTKIGEKTPKPTLCAKIVHWNHDLMFENQCCLKGKEKTWYTHVHMFVCVRMRTCYWLGITQNTANTSGFLRVSTKNIDVLAICQGNIKPHCK